MSRLGRCCASGLLACCDIRMGLQTGVIMLKTMLLSGVALIGLTGLASAADMYVKAPPVLYVPTWTGCYLGGHAGYGQTTSTSSYNLPGGILLFEEFEGASNGSFNQSFDNKGFAGGGH